ncbi:MAG: CoA pyrophosphatase [Bacillota bacterium]|nr:CoA pyrophosphatase [Bacillota bacterium]
MNNDLVEKLKSIIPMTPVISHREEFFNSAVLVLLICKDNEYHFIFEKRSLNIRQGGEICFPGGGVNPKKDKNSLDTAIRETVEELGIGEDKIKIIGGLETIFSPIGALVDGYLAVADIDNIDDLKISQDEVDKVFTVPVSFFIKNEPEKYNIKLMAHPSYKDEDGNEITLLPANELGLPETYSKPWGNTRYGIYVYKVKNETIWGITARFIYNLVNLLNKLEDK